MPKNVVHGSQLDKDEVVEISHGESGRRWNHGNIGYGGFGRKRYGLLALDTKKDFEKSHSTVVYVEERYIYDMILNFEYKCTFPWREGYVTLIWKMNQDNNKIF